MLREGRVEGTNLKKFHYLYKKDKEVVPSHHKYHYIDSPTSAT